MVRAGGEDGARRAIVTLLVGAFVFTAAACDEQSPDPSLSPEACPDAIQFKDRSYLAWDNVPREEPSAGTAVRGVCGDVSPADGLSFPADGATVEIATFTGFRRAVVVGAEGNDGEFYAYVSEDVPESRAERIVARLVNRENAAAVDTLRETRTRVTVARSVAFDAATYDLIERELTR